MKQKIIFTTTTILICIAIFLFSSQNGQASSNTSSTFLHLIQFFIPSFNNMFLIRKTAHFSIYAMLGISNFFMMKAYGIKKSSLWALIFCFLFACSDEFHQLFIDQRAGQFRDVIIDTSGALCAILCLNLWIHSHKSYKN